MIPYPTPESNGICSLAVAAPLARYRGGPSSSLYRRPNIVPPGLPPADAVRWLRPSEASGGDQVVLFVGDTPGESPLAPGLVGRVPRLVRSGLPLPVGQSCASSVTACPGGGVASCRVEGSRYRRRLLEETRWKRSVARKTLVDRVVLPMFGAWNPVSASGGYPMATFVDEVSLRRLIDQRMGIDGQILDSLSIF